MRFFSRRFGTSADTLLKVGVAATTFAIACVGVLAAYVLLNSKPETAEAKPAEAAGVKAASAEPLVRSDPGVEPWKEEDVPPPRLQKEPESEPPPAPKPEPEPPPKPEPPPEPKPQSEPEAVKQPEPQPKPGPRPRPERAPEPDPLPVKEAGWPAPTGEQVEATKERRRYDLPSGAALGLTVPSIGLYDVPVLESDTQRALDRGVIHARGTSMPWSPTPERNVYLAGHRLGWPGTGSHLVFYRLNELGRGDNIILKGRNGRKYTYRVKGSFAVRPDETWVTGRIPGRDMLTLQTCTPIPGFQKRLIVRAERV